MPSAAGPIPSPRDAGTGHAPGPGAASGGTDRTAARFPAGRGCAAGGAGIRAGPLGPVGAARLAAGLASAGGIAQGHRPAARVSARRRARRAALPLLAADEAMRQSREMIPDDRLRLIFTCCHPALDPKSRVALTLRTLGGLTTAEIARAFLDPEPTMGQRLSPRQGQDRRRRHPLHRAGARRPGRPAEFGPDRGLPDLQCRLYRRPATAATATSATRRSISPACLIACNPIEAEVEGLPCAAAADPRPPRRAAGATARPWRSADQDRSLWDSAHAGRGPGLARHAPWPAARPGPFQIKAAIAACHVTQARARLAPDRRPLRRPSAA